MKKVFDFQFGLVLVSALLLLAFSALTSQAQITRGTISGTVRDENGAVVPGAQVTITSTTSSLTKRDATTDEQGFYRVGALDPGSYNVLVEKDGFARLENRDVVVKSAGEVKARAERPPRSAQDDHLDLRIDRGAVHRRLELIRHRRHDRVEALGPV